MAMIRAEILARTRKIMEAFRAGHITADEAQSELERLLVTLELSRIKEGEDAEALPVGLVFDCDSSHHLRLLGSTENEKALVRSH